MLAYYETITAGMVKVKIVNRIPANAALRRLESFECVVTARGNRVYPYGYTIVLPVDNTSLLPLFSLPVCSALQSQGGVC
jgi:hypothetical protein